MQDFEKLGQFYLGKVYDLGLRRRTDSLVLYDSKDLVTHAVCVGMTGSGKTGLCIGLLEEAAIDGIPSIVIDPKGDLSNMLLTFPQLRGEDFRPWINEEDAASRGLTPDQLAQAQADLWKKGLAEWGQDGTRIQRFKDAAEFVVYTPGSNAGVPVSILSSFAAPEAAVREDSELLRDRINASAAGLLGLIGVDADPIRSRDHILLSTILSRSWLAGVDLDLSGLIQQIQKPPVSRIGVMELESFFPEKDRFALAMAINNLLASPGFEAWMEGQPLDIAAMLNTPTGKPRVNIFSIAHLSDAERMFFVSLLLAQVLGWVRSQSGTTSLRAIVYMDEIAGYFPPTANPPSKAPLLTLMKQARAFGVGVVLATQNPVDLDYKGLSNAGTWFIGRLQTERDKARVLDGLEGAAASASSRFDRASVEAALSQLGSRVFLMNNVHEDGPEIIESRWALSYLQGPLTRNQIRKLTQERASKSPPTAAHSTDNSNNRKVSDPVVPGGAGAEVQAGSSQRPVLPPEIPQFFLPVRGERQEGDSLVYRPMLLGTAKVYYNEAKLRIESEESVAYLAGVVEGPVAVDWDHAEEIELADSDLDHDAAPGAAFGGMPGAAAKTKSYDVWKKSFADLLFRVRKLEVFRSKPMKQSSRAGETEREFRLRLAQAAREQRDAFAERLRAKYATTFNVLSERLRKAEQAVRVQEGQARDAKVSTALSFGSAILGAFLGRKTVSAGTVSKAATAARGASRSLRESGDIGRAEETVEAVKRSIANLETQFQAEIDQAAAKVDPLQDELETVSIKPKKTNIAVRAVVLAWAPHWMDRGGGERKAWE